MPLRRKGIEGPPLRFLHRRHKLMGELPALDEPIDVLDPGLERVQKS